MSKLSDEILMAYADGELSAAGRATVERRLAEDGDARARLARMQSSAEMARQAFEGISAEPVPDNLVRAIRQSARTHMERRPPRLWEHVRALMERPLPVFGGAPSWALGLALVFGVGLGFGYLGGSETGVATLAEIGPVDADSELHRALDSIPAGRESALGDGRFTAIVTFRSRDGRFCREFEVHGGAVSADLRVGLACRTLAEAWVVEFVTAGGVQPSTGEGLHAPASAEVLEAMDTYVRRLVDGEGPLSADQEAALIDNGWRAARP